MALWVTCHKQIVSLDSHFSSSRVGAYILPCIRRVLGSAAYQTRVRQKKMHRLEEQVGRWGAGRAGRGGGRQGRRIEWESQDGGVTWGWGVGVPALNTLPASADGEAKADTWARVLCGVEKFRVGGSRQF